MSTMPPTDPAPSITRYSSVADARPCPRPTSRRTGIPNSSAKMDQGPPPSHGPPDHLETPRREERLGRAHNRRGPRHPRPVESAGDVHFNVGEPGTVKTR